MKKDSGNYFLVILFITIWLIPINVTGQDGNQTTTPKKLRFVVPARELNDFVTVRISSDGVQNFSGFSIEVFRKAAEIAIPSTTYELIAYSNPDGSMKGSFDDMLAAVHNKEYDGAIGDITIIYYRMQQWVDFTIPYLASEIGLLVRVNTKDGNRVGLIATTKILLTLALLLGFGILLAVAFWIWKLCTPNPSNTILVIILVLMVLLLIIASYMPLQSSTISTQPFVSDIKNLDDLKRKNSKVGYRKGAFVKNTLISKGGLSESQLVEINSEVEMVDKLRKGGEDGGVDALVAATQYLQLFQAKYCDNFTLVPTFHLPSSGFGFAFPQDDPSPDRLVDKFSKAIVKLIDNEDISKIQARTIGDFDNVCQTTNASTFEDHIALWLPVASAIFVVALVILMLLSYYARLCINT